MLLNTLPQWWVEQFNFFFFMLKLLLFASLLDMGSATCPFHNVGTPPAGHPPMPVQSKSDYHEYLGNLDVEGLYRTIEKVMLSDQSCWPADGGQNDDTPSYAGDLFAP